MRVKFKLEGEPDIVSVFEVGFVGKERYKYMWVITYANFFDHKSIYNIVTIVPTENVADYFIEQALKSGYIDVSDYKTVTIEELEELAEED